ncbi:uncharacterized protein ACUXJ9_002523 [Staphylococcus caledonicus]
MNDYKYMHPQGPKVIRIASLITFAVLLLILIITNIVDIYFMHLTKPIWSITISIGILVLFLVIFTVITPILRFKNFRYYYKDHGIYIRTGIIFINTKIIPFYRIQNIDVVEGYLMRKYQLATLYLSTAGGNSEIQLINKQDAYELKKILQIKKSNHQDQITEEPTEEQISE